MAKKKGLWANIHAKRKRGEAPAKKGDKDYPETLDIGEGLKQARKNVGADKCWDGYKAKGTKKKDGKEVPNCVKETKTFGEFCTEAKSRIETDPEYQKRFKAMADKVASGKKKDVKEQSGDGYLGPRRLGIKNPLASDATRAKTDAAAKATATKNLKTGGKPKGGLVNRLQQRADMIDRLGENTTEILDAEGKLVAEIIDLIGPGEMTGWRQEVAEAAWTKKAGKSEAGGLNEKGRKSYERENPGSDLKAPSKKVGNKRRDSFCARMGGMKKKLTSKKTANDPDSRINKSLRAWNC